MANLGGDMSGDRKSNLADEPSAKGLRGDARESGEIGEIEVTERRETGWRVRFRDIDGTSRSVWVPHAVLHAARECGIIRPKRVVPLDGRPAIGSGATPLLKALSSLEAVPPAEAPEAPDAFEANPTLVVGLDEVEDLRAELES